MDAEGFQVAKISKALGRLGHTLSIVTYEDEGNISRSSDCSIIMPKQADVHHIKSLERLFPKFNFFQRVLKRAIPFIGYPSLDFLWLLPAFRKCKALLTARHYDLIYSRGHPPVSNVLGLKVKQHAMLPWIAHFSDPWLHNPLNPLQGMKQRLCARYNDAIHLHADLLYYTSMETVDYLQAKGANLPLEKLRILLHGYDPEEYTNIVRDTNRRREVLMVYTGMFYRKRSPEYFIRALEAVHAARNLKNQFKVTFVGPIGPEIVDRCKALLEEHIVSFAGVQGRSETNTICNDADVLLLIDSTEEDARIFFPSKLIDYLPYQKPILALSNKTSVSTRILASLGIQTVDPNDVPMIMQRICDALDGRLFNALDTNIYNQRIHATPYTNNQIV